MDVRSMLLEAGFKRIIALDAAACNEEFTDGTLLLAIWPYEVERVPDMTGAWIHPYYYASQQAYMAASRVVEEAKDLGMNIHLRDDVRVKPIFVRLKGFTQGRNTLSYIDGYGSRFHVQIIWQEEKLADTQALETEQHELHCGSCRACIDACPNQAIDEEGFHREKCIRNWMMSGKPIPMDVRETMGSRLIGCDECQRCCPHNASPKGEQHPSIPLERLLEEPKEACQQLRAEIGVNLSIPNRVLSQVCVMAGSAGRQDLLAQLETLENHPSPTVQEHARWAVQAIRNTEK